ncbi:MAG TPA: hypothetical protein VMB73_07985 [Acetobacteraceae bacterium]|jgi:hypothetical protein|nr:hypothetical protein [Acetobacteraceae bacterium]
MILDRAFCSSDPGFVAPIHRPPLDPLGPYQACAHQHPHVFAQGGVVAEPGSAAAFAGLLSGRYRPSAKERVAVVVCGANTTAVRFDE